MTNTTEAAVRAVRDTIQRVYGDATQAILDDQAAREIIRVLRAAGWASLDEVALLIESAGGTITVPNRLQLDSRERRVTRQDDFLADGQKFTVSVSA